MLLFAVRCFAAAYAIISLFLLSCIEGTGPVAILNQKEFIVGVGNSFIVDGSQSFSRDGEILEYNWEITPKTGTKIRTLHPYRINVITLHTGEYEISLYVVDANKNSIPAVASIKVMYPPKAVITAPSVVKPNKNYTFKGDRSFTYYENPLEYKWSIVPAHSVIFDSNNEKNINVFFSKAGEYTISLSVDNGIIKSVTEYKTVIVSDIPVAYIDSPSVVPLNHSFYLNGGRSRSPDDQTLNFSWRAYPKDGISIHSPSAEHTKTTITKEGSYTISLSVDNGVAVSKTVETVIKTNNPPKAHILRNITAAVDEIVTLDASKSYDPDGDEITYYWNVTPSSGHTMLNRNSEKIDLQIHQGGEYTVSLRVHDGYSISEIDSTSFITHRNPEARIPKFLVVSSNTAITIDGSESFSPDGNALSYEWDVSPNLRIKNINKHIFEVAPVSEPGTYFVFLKVYDGYNYSNEVYTTLYIRDTYFVNLEAKGKNSGRSWNDAYNNLQDALNDASSGSQIWVADGTYIPSSPYYTDDDNSKRFVIPPGIKLYGGFSGRENNFEEREPKVYKSILSGDILQNDDDTNPKTFSDNVYTVIHHVATDDDDLTVLDGFYIQDAVSSKSMYYLYSGNGVYTHGGSLRLANTHFINNTSDGFGAGIYNNSSYVEIVYSRFINNAAKSGAAIYSLHGELILYNSDVISNTSSNGASIMLFYSNADIVNCIISANSGSEGSAIYGVYSTVNIHNATITGNELTHGLTAKGSALFLIKSKAKIINSIVYDNRTNNSSEATFSQNIFNDRSDIIYRSSLIEGWSEREEFSFQTAIGDTIIDKDPRFRRSSNPLGETQNLRSGDENLLLNSPAVNAGDVRLIPYDLADVDNDGNRKEFLPLDRDGNPRVHPADYIDMGAFEHIY